MEKSKKAGKGFKFAIVCMILLFLVFVTALILSMVLETNIGNYILLLTGIFDLIVAFVVYKVADHREKYICPECGTKRVHHREYLRTEGKDHTFRSNNQMVFVTEYTHYYSDTYECPKCGTVMQINIQKSGGKYYQYSDGHVRDERHAPQEF